MVLALRNTAHSGLSQKSGTTGLCVWPIGFDWTRGNLGEGPATTLDDSQMVSSDKETVLITQKGSSQDTEYTQRSGRENVHQAQACMMMRRKIQEGEACAACGAIFKHRQNCLQRTKFDAKVCNAACSTDHAAQAMGTSTGCAAAVAVAHTHGGDADRGGGDDRRDGQHCGVA